MSLAILKHVPTEQTTITFLQEDQGIHIRVIRGIGLETIPVGHTTMEEVELLELAVEVDSIITIRGETKRMYQSDIDSDEHMSHNLVSEN